MVMPGLVPGIQPTIGPGASGMMDPVTSTGMTGPQCGGVGGSTLPEC